MMLMAAEIFKSIMIIIIMKISNKINNKYKMRAQKKSKRLLQCKIKVI